tara:strand:+ start:25 stop:1062 length:1038 start_codon:yes stop_codon:yes gene_type:complete
MSNIQINPYNFAAGEIGSWKEIDRETLIGSANDMTVGTFAQNRYYMILWNGIATGGTLDDIYLQTGNTTVDTGTSYAARVNNGNPDQEYPSVTNMLIDKNNGAFDRFGYLYMTNIADQEKLLQGERIQSNGATATTAPLHLNSIGKWADTLNVADILKFTNQGSGNFNNGSEVIILAWTPSTSQLPADNFWQELASTDLSAGAADDISSGTFTAKKYLWVQTFMELNGTTITGNVNFNGDVANNYSQKRSSNGGAWGASDTNSTIDVRGGEAKDRFENLFILNVPTKEKLIIGSMMASPVSSSPDRTKYVAKWENASQITEINYNNTDAGGSYGTKTMIKVWGHD